jgi:tryptophan halogenase
MTYKTKNIIIVGGGSAGWMTASTIVSLYPDKNITLIESPNISSVGVGESTLGDIRHWMNMIGIKEEDFFTECDASYKMSIKFTDFYDKDYGSFQYPFGNVMFDPNSQFGLNDWFIKKYYYPETSTDDYYRSFFPHMALIENNRFSENKTGVFGNFTPSHDVAYHFDSTKFANWLSEKFAKPRGVKQILSDVKDINVDDSGITNIILDDDSVIEGDLYIDCTGFKSLLLGQALEEPFKSYQSLLPNNRAWATKIPYKDRDQELQPFTECTAIDNGWVWNIPCWSRIGTGYVYSDEFISKQEALDQFKDHLKTKKGVENPNELEYKDIEMRIGIHKRTWVKNVVAIGLSAGFIEPLESNGLFTVHEFLIKLCKFIRYDSINRLHRDVYNSATSQKFDSVASFVSSHYSLSIRDDTEYWKKVSETCYNEGEIFYNSESYMLPILTEQQDYANCKWDVRNGIHCICTGMNFIPLDDIMIKTWFFVESGIEHSMPSYIQSIIAAWNYLYSIRYEAAMQCPTLNNYLNQKYYGTN